MPNGIEQFDGSETAIGHGDDLPVWKPARDLQHDLPAAVSEFLMPLPVFRAYRLDGARTVKNGSAQMRPAQGNLGQQHDRQPSQTTALTKCPCEGRAGPR